MLKVLNRTVSIRQPKHLFKLTNKKLITILQNVLFITIIAFYANLVACSMTPLNGSENMVFPASHIHLFLWHANNNVYYIRTQI